jgi:hypothetical protein
LATQTLNHILDKLERAKREFGPAARVSLSKLLSQISRRRFTDAASLIRFHEALLFMRAYPQSLDLLVQTEEALLTFPARIEHLEKIDADLSPFAAPEVSGIAGTSLTAIFSYEIARWLVQHHSSETEIDWEGYEDNARIGATLPRILPFLEEEALVESHPLFLQLLRAAKQPNETDAVWLMKNFSRLPLSEKEKGELYDSLKIYLRWKPGYTASRTGLKSETKEIFYHTGPLISRRDVSVEEELNEQDLPVEKISAKEGAKVLNLIRNASTARYRELHGFTHGDAKSFVKVNLGRGVDVFMNETLPERRLPLRAYHSGFMLKNGVPIGYVEGLSLFERMEIGFNLYYTFREGETAWLYAKLLHLFKQALGITVFSVDPYQIGHENEEGIESGAFWFYRKLGFRPAREDVVWLVQKEEKKIATDPTYRTPARALRKIATCHLIYMNAECGMRNAELDHFHIRSIALSLQRRMAQSFGGNAERMRKETTKRIARVLNVSIEMWNQTEKEAFSNFALVLSFIPNLVRWSSEEKNLLVETIRAKGSASEARYLQFTQKHERLRNAFIKLGNSELKTQNLELRT